jgi:hypothetical protein
MGCRSENFHFRLDIPEAKRKTYEIYLAMVPLRLEAFLRVRDLVRACSKPGLLVAVAHTFPAECLREADIVCDRISQVPLSDLALGESTSEAT